MSSRPLVRVLFCAAISLVLSCFISAAGSAAAETTFRVEPRFLAQNLVHDHLVGQVSRLTQNSDMDYGAGSVVQWKVHMPPGFKKYEHRVAFSLMRDMQSKDPRAAEDQPIARHLMDGSHSSADFRKYNADQPEVYLGHLRYVDKHGVHHDPEELSKELQLELGKAIQKGIRMTARQVHAEPGFSWHGQSTGGVPQEIAMPAHWRITGIRISFSDEGTVVSQLRVTYEDPAGARYEAGFGSAGGSGELFQLSPGERITSVSGKAGENINQLVFSTNTGRSKQFGDHQGGKSFGPQAGGQLCGIRVFCAEKIDRIGFLFRN